MKLTLLIAFALLAFASAQNEDWIRETSYYTDANCIVPSIVSAHGLVVDQQGCIEQACLPVEGRENFWAKITCRAETIVVPIPDQWPEFFLYATDGCPASELVDFFYSAPGVCHPINLRDQIVYITASCYQWGIGATICDDACGGQSCYTVNGTTSCSLFKFPFADAWVLGECPRASEAPTTTAPTTSAPTTNTPQFDQVSIPAVLIVDSAGAISSVQWMCLAFAAIAALVL